MIPGQMFQGRERAVNETNVALLTVFEWCRETLGDVELRVICGIRIWELPKIGILHPLVRANINDAARSSSG